MRRFFQGKRVDFLTSSGQERLLASNFPNVLDRSNCGLYKTEDRGLTGTQLWKFSYTGSSRWMIQLQDDLSEFCHTRGKDNPQHLRSRKTLKLSTHAKSDVTCERNYNWYKQGGQVVRVLALNVIRNPHVGLMLCARTTERDNLLQRAK